MIRIRYTILLGLLGTPREFREQPGLSDILVIKIYIPASSAVLQRRVGYTTLPLLRATHCEIRCGTESRNVLFRTMSVSSSFQDELSHQPHVSSRGAVAHPDA